MKRILRSILKLLVLSVFAFSVFLCPPLSRAIARAEDWAKVTLTIKDVKLKTEIADTVMKKAAGLMYRESLDENAGMIFLFSVPERVNFWMKDTKIPLSIAFIDAGGVIKEIRDMEPMDTTAITSKDEVSYALEVNQGWFKKNKIKPGDKVLGLDKIE